MGRQHSLRAPRAAMFAAASVALDAASHSLTAGVHVPTWGLVVGFLTMYGLAWPLTRRECSLRVIAVGVLGSQMLLHAFFSWAPVLATSAAAPAGGPPAGSGVTPHPDGSTGVGHGHAHTHDPVTLFQAVGDGGSAMLAAHVTAALCVAWWLRRGEAALWSLLRWIAAMTTGAIAVAVALLTSPAYPSAPGIGSAGTGAPAQAQRSLLLRHVIVSRGPPVPHRV